MNFAVIGNRGMFGSEIFSVLKEKGLQVVGFNRNNLDLEKITVEELANLFKNFKVVVNAVAYTAVDKAETDSKNAYFVNAEIVQKQADATAMANTRFIHISTDYVFDGSIGIPRPAYADVRPQNVYGNSKAMGEKFVENSGADYAILRTAWLYGAGGRCFPKIIADLLERNGSVRVVGDQIGQPTWTKDLAEQVIQVAQLNEMPRIVHAVSSGQASWAEFAKEIAKSIGLDESVVEEITTDDFPTLAKRPAWSVLDNSSDLLEPIGDWRERWAVAAKSVLAAR